MSIAALNWSTEGEGIKLGEMISRGEVSRSGGKEDVSVTPHTAETVHSCARGREGDR